MQAVWQCETWLAIACKRYWKTNLNKAMMKLNILKASREFDELNTKTIHEFSIYG